MALIPADKLESLTKALGNDFTFNDLGLVMQLCFGEPRINGVSSDRREPWTIARDCLEETERHGMTRLFLGHVLASARSGEVLRGLIVLLVPELAAAPTSVASNVGVVVAQLQRTQVALADAGVRDTVHQSRAVIEDIAVSVAALEVYKNLHDSLHNLQLRNFSTLFTAAKHVKDGADDGGVLRQFVDDVRKTCVDSRPVAQRLARDDELRAATELKWIDRLEGAARELRGAIDREDSDRARVALNMIRRVVEQEPSRLNSQIFLIARDLQLAQLEDALKRVESVQGGSGIGGASASLQALKWALLARVVEHTRWQEADDGLWAVDRSFEYGNDRAIDDFALDWPNTRSLIRTLIDAEPKAELSIGLASAAENIDQELFALAARIDAAASQAAVSRRLFGLYDGYRRDARFRFYLVDRALKDECRELVALGMPLQSILTELQNA